MSFLHQDVSLMFEVEPPSRAEIAMDVHGGASAPRPSRCCREVAQIDANLNATKPAGFRCVDCPCAAAMAVAA